MGSCAERYFVVERVLVLLMGREISTVNGVCEVRVSVGWPCSNCGSVLVGW